MKDKTNRQGVNVMYWESATVAFWRGCNASQMAWRSLEEVHESGDELGKIIEHTTRY